MKTTYNLLRYEARVYLKTAKYIMPMAAMLIFLAGLYSVSPVDVVGTVSFSATVLFFVMAWVGLAYGEVEDPVSEQLLILKSKSATRYYLSTTVFLLGISVVFSLLAVGYPLILDLLRGPPLYKVAPTVGEVGLSFCLHVFMGFMGATVGALLHPRIVKDRKVALLMLLFITVVGLVKIGIHRLAPFTAALTWLFPPVSEVAAAFAKVDTMSVSLVAYSVGLSLLYAAVMTALRTVLLVRRKF